MIDSKEKECEDIIANKDEEIWKDVEDYEGIYQISNYGNFKSCHRHKLIKGGLSVKGYKTVALCRQYEAHTTQLHRLVGVAFIPNPENKPQINHKNGIKTNNRVENLEWVTDKENREHAVRMGLTCRGENKTSSKLKEGEVLRIKELHKSGNFGYKKLSKMYKVCYKTIRNIIKGKKWAHIN